MRLGDVVNGDAARLGRPLDGVRILAAEQMQALPYATQLLARLGADVVKVEHPGAGESGRGSFPHMLDPEGRKVGATFLRNNLGKRSLAIDLKHPEGRELFLSLVPRFDVVCENFKAGTMDRLGLGYDVIAERHPGAIFLSLSGFGNTVETPYRSWPAYASVVEAMSGIYEYKREAGRGPRANPVGALGDISSALFGTIGVLAALRHRDRTGEGQQIDIAMLDAVVAMTDIVTNLWSMGIHGSVEDEIKAIVDTFAAGDGYFVLQCVRPQHFTALAEVIGRAEWNDDARFATSAGWIDNIGEVRTAVEAWAAPMTKVEAAAVLSAAGLAAGPCLTPPEVIDDPHVAARHMLVEVTRTDDPDGERGPILVPGNPVKMSKVAEGPETRVPWLGEHTAEVLAAELGLGDDDLAKLRADGVIG
ncbi:MAG TPA: CaiB/BaiF CoA-transferase family protein [Acidimicrobiales bacterium]|nr:CaiB/BaiF CoA-transferase family protein [Acidimicrobiales bacterium]